MGAKIKITVVIPVYNEEKNIVLVFSELCSIFKNMVYEFRVLFVDDGSTDSTVAQIEELKRSHLNVSFISFSRNFGHQVAVTAGLDHVDGDAVIMMDGDLQHPPSLIPKMLAKWQSGFDIVYTIRKDTCAGGFFKTLSSKIYYKIFRFFTGFDMPAGTADFRLFDRQVLEVFKSLNERHRFLRGLSHWVGFKSAAIEYTANERRYGKTKYSFNKMMTLALDGLCSFSIKPLIIPFFVGLVFFMGGALSLALMVWAKLVWNSFAGEGWIFLIPIVLILSGVNLLFISLLGLYVGKIFEQGKNRPLYILRRLESAEKIQWSPRVTDSLEL
jgi:dolichol-phosphate mannosyltransferase